MDDMVAREILQRLADLHQERENVLTEMQQKIDAVLSPVRAQYEAVTAEYQRELDAVNNAIKSAEANLTDQVIGVGHTVKEDGWMAVLVSGRVSWDTKGLDGYRVAHPEIEAFRSVGQPYVVIRKPK